MDRAGANKSHEPVREGECKVCHQVHGSAGAALVDPVKERDLCVSCHPRPKGGHHLFTEGELVSKTSREERNLCLFCHRPHSSTERRLLRSMASPVCQGCHGI